MAIEDETLPLPRDERRPRPPAFNVPVVVLATILAFALVQGWRSVGLSTAADDRLLVDFAFIPGCYSQNCALFDPPRAAGALYWSPLTHAFLHGDWMHLGLNTIWLLAFGTPVARRLGVVSFLAFCSIGAVAGAAVFYGLNRDLLVPVVGASGVVSALMGGACRFAFSSMGRGHQVVSRLPLLSVGEALGDRTILFFILVFFATNLVTAVGAGGFMNGGAQVAWEAHLGGFAFGFLCFGLFDRLRSLPPVA